jgi:DNA-binding transcriptional LysR family regulator
MSRLRQLHYFVTIAKEGQMTSAAKTLRMAQPALSQAIARLEQNLGVALLERHPRGVSLTAAGEAFYAKASAVLAAMADAESTARSLARAARRTIKLGFIGSAPTVVAPELFSAFAERCPDVEFAFHELPFPFGSTATWLEEVDVALCYSPTRHRDVHIQMLRQEPRVVVAAREHPLARSAELTVAEVLDHTFCGANPLLEPRRAGFWSLDDHRGGPPRHTTADRTTNPQEMLEVVASGRAITTAPASNVEHFAGGLGGIVVIPLLDARPTVLSLVWHRNNHNPLVPTLIATARELAGDGAELPEPVAAVRELRFRGHGRRRGGERRRRGVTRKGARGVVDGPGEQAHQEGGVDGGRHEQVGVRAERKQGEHANEPAREEVDTPDERDRAHRLLEER